ncbi:MAG: hypothetical protein HOC74_14280 [Gemmatimonadetes bacterium]|nr:hypothetical protein [Gemmatimonadota bacterium]
MSESVRRLAGRTGNGTMKWMVWVIMVWMMVVGCGGDDAGTAAGPGEGKLEVWTERWENGRIKVEYQYYFDEEGVPIRHGYYREYSQFVDGLVVSEGRFFEGERDGEWYERCVSSQPLPLFENGGFELGSFDGWRLEGAREHSIELVADEDPGRGAYSARLTLHPGDIIRGGNRVELVRMDSANFQQERIYSWSFKIDEEYREEPFWQTFCQFHSQPDFSSGEDWDSYPEYRPSLSILYSNGVCTLKHISLDQVARDIGTFEIEKGEWFEVFFQIKWSLEGDGYVEMYVDDQPVTPFNGADYKYYGSNVFNEVGNYLKIGLYRDIRAVEINSVYVDDLYVGDC